MSAALAHSVSQLVVIGSSAGGIEALSTLVATLPPDFGAPIVIAQHLDPSRSSHLAEILARRSTIPVRTVTDHTQLQAGVVFVAPTNSHVEISAGTIDLRAESVGRHKPSIDLLFSSAAAAYGDTVIAVILSGTGSDGAAGARLVKAAGGTVVIQDPSTASYPGMPLALAPTTVDIVAPLDRIGPILADLLAGTAVPTLPPEQEALASFLADVRERFGLDFTQYKPPTILRRLQRRILATDTDTLAGYLLYLETHPAEYQQLFNAFLIKVTEFFRDPEVFAYLRDTVLPPLIAQGRTQGQVLRFWSAGCATGEEAYSLAILVAEALGPDLEHFHVRIFATDADAEAVAFARRGIYPAQALANLSEDLRERYFTKEEAFYTVKKRLRTLTIFGQHDLAQRAPFPHLDLVLCRNVLIYFTNDLQARTLHLFTYALRQGGMLVLGKAESVGPLGEFYQMQQKHLKVYRRRGTPLALPPTAFAQATNVGQGTFRQPTQPLAQRQPPGLSPSQAMQEHVLLKLPVGAVVVNRRYAIQTLNLAARRLFSIHGPALGDDLVHLVQGVPPQALRAAIDATFRTGDISSLTEVTLEQVVPGTPSSLQITVHPLRSADEEGPIEGVSVVVQDITALVTERQTLQRQLATTTAAWEEVQREAAHQMEQVRHEASGEAARREELIGRLVETNRLLLEANQELSSTNEELRTTNDAVVVGQEESQAAVEEVKTLNEELQASNEELETLNEELQATVEELQTTNDDVHARSLELHDLAQTYQAEQARLAAVLLSMGDAVLVVNQEASPVLTNRAYELLFGPFDARFVALGTDDQPLALEATPQQRAAHGESFTMEFTLTQEGIRRTFEANGHPIQDEEGQQQGGVIVIRDITERSLHLLQDAFLSLASHELRTPLTSLSGMLQLLLKKLGGPPYDPPVLISYVERALRQVKRLGGLVDDLLEVSRLQQGKYTLHPERVTLQELIGQAVEVAQLTTTRHTIQMELTSEPLVVLGDAARLEQVLLNLLTNAIRYAPTSEQIVVRLERVGLDARIQIEDTGPGIPAADLPRLFTRFYQGANPSERSGHGLGLGLHLTHELVTAHGGRIEVASVEGQGTTFSISLPALNGEAELVQSRSDEYSSTAE